MTLFTFSLLAGTDSTHAASADQDHPAHLCRLIMIRTVCYSISTNYYFSPKMMNGFIQLER
jgi:hypothetical protein